MVGLGAAAALVAAELQPTARHMALLRDRLQARLLGGLPEGAARVNGPPDLDPGARLPNTLSISIPGVQASALLAELADALAASAGAACHSSSGGGGPPVVSPVLRAMGLPERAAAGTLRLSVGRHTTAEDVDRAAALILDYCSRQGLAR